jgi:hypothetical protein
MTSLDSFPSSRFHPVQNRQHCLHHSKYSIKVLYIRVLKKQQDGLDSSGLRYGPTVCPWTHGNDTMLYTSHVTDNILVEVYPTRGQEGQEGELTYSYTTSLISALGVVNATSLSLYPLERDLVPLVPRAGPEGWAIYRQEFFPSITLVWTCIKVTVTCFGWYTQPPLGNTLKNV